MRCVRVNGGSVPCVVGRALVALSLLVACLSLSGGCTSSTKEGDLTAVRFDSTLPRAGNVYLLRGWIGIFSAGIDNLTAELNQAGVRAHVYQEMQWPSLRDRLGDAYAHQGDHEPLVLVGHSYGADSVIRIARELQDRHVTVDLLITLDPVTPPKVPANVARTVNLYQSNGFMDNFPWLRGIPLENADGNRNPLVNIDLRTDRPDLVGPDLDHFNVEKQPGVHQEILRQVLGVCPPRQVWVSTREAQGRRRMPAVTGTTAATRAAVPLPPPLPLSGSPVAPASASPARQ
jgi:pimeloyl-ACP methyl ester carboxylesterase